MTFVADAAGVLVVSGPGRRKKVAGSIIMVWLGSQGEGGAGGGMDCAVSELRARNGRGCIPQSGGGQTVMYVLVGVVLQSMYCNVTQRLVPVPCLSLS